jgi:hypothetical protein
MLIVGTDAKQTNWVAEAVIARWVDDHRDARITYFHFQRDPEGELLFSNRNMHWIANCAPYAAKAAAKATALYLDPNMEKSTTLAMRFAASSTYTIVCVPETGVCPMLAEQTMLLV